jgi:hypothetical protein
MRPCARRRDRPRAPAFGYPGRVPHREDPPRSVLRTAGQAGVVLSAFAVFACGWLAMRSEAWPRILLFSVLAVGAAALASFFRRWT